MENTSIGNVKLDYSHYGGRDLYCDGEIEEQLLDMVKEYSMAEYGKLIENSKSWPVLYHLSNQRGNIVSWLPMDKTMKILEIGAGCGAITGVLSKKAGRVDCVDLSEKRSKINAYRHEYENNITIHIGNFMDIEPDLDRDYDYVLLIGVLEYARSYIGGEKPYEDFLKIAAGHTKQGGRTVIAIENKYGLKYFAGCREDHLGDFFASMEGYTDDDGVRTFSRRGLEQLLTDTGINNYSFYYPYPDYKFMTTLFSDNRLPVEGELCDNLRNFDRDRLLLFDEASAFDEIIREEMFPFFSNSYLLVIGDRPDVDYVRYSNDRDLKYQISTTITSSSVIKRALDSLGGPHIKAMEEAGKLLKERYKGGELTVVPCTLSEDREEAVFPLVKGTPLTKRFDELLFSGDSEGFLELFREYVRRIGYNGDSPITDMDLVFSNILVDGDNWQVIDYEWIRKKSLPVSRVAFRGLYCYTCENHNRIIENFDKLIDVLGLTRYELEGLREEEAVFQKEITGKRQSMAELREHIGKEVYTTEMLMAAIKNKKSAKNRFQIYTDMGRGFNEEDSFLTDKEYNEDGEIEFSIPLESGTIGVRLDPMTDYCIATLKELHLNGKAIDLLQDKRIRANGRRIKNKDGSITIVFENDDPGIEVVLRDIVRSTGNILKVRLRAVVMPEDMLASLNLELKKKIRI